MLGLLLSDRVIFRLGAFMQARSVNKRIGKVEVFELSGHFKGPIASRCEMHIKKEIEKKEKDYSIMYYAKAIEEFDDMGAKVLVENSKSAQKCAVVAPNSFTAEVLLRNDTDHKLFIFEEEEKAVFYLGRELAVEAQSHHQDRRMFPRLKVAVPARGYFGNKDSNTPSFFAVAVNLSPQGMFAQFLDSESEIALRRNLDLYDLKMMKFSLALSAQQTILTEGKVIHLDSLRKGFGAEFYSISEEDKLLLKEFLRQETRDDL